MEEGLPVPNVVRAFTFILIEEAKGLHHGITPTGKIINNKKGKPATWGCRHAGLPQQLKCSLAYNYDSWVLGCKTEISRKISTVVEKWCINIRSFVKAF